GGAGYHRRVAVGARRSTSSVDKEAAIPAPDLPAAVGVIVLYAVTLWLPGALAGAAAGLRGWTLAATAPLLTYAIAGLAGPVLAAFGGRWSAAAFALVTIIVGLV